MNLHINLRSVFAGFIALLLLNGSYGQQILVSPYIQPGNASNFLKEEKVLIWQTDNAPGNFKVEFTTGSLGSGKKIATAKISSNSLTLGSSTSIIYRAPLRKLAWNAVYNYRVWMNDKVISEGSFKSRHKNGATRFAVFGDCGRGTNEQRQIAQQVLIQTPQFILIPGDIVYDRGLMNEYLRNFFPIYNSDSSTGGVPLMSSIPFYSIIGNHDVNGMDLDKFPDGLAYFYYHDLPLNAPSPKFTAEVKGNPQTTAAFKKNTASRFPGMANYSFDYGNVHVVCLDANPYINPLDPELVAWMRNDLTATRADWKIVAYHHPGFNSSKAHYYDQQMRLLDPLLQQLKVDLVFAGHVHNYQRTLPLKFNPKMNEDKTMYVISKEGRVDGEFILDQNYDGKQNRKPNGIIYIVTGAGGAPLYDMDFTDNPTLWKHEPPENWAPFTVKMISDKHSFTWIETEKTKLTLKQIDVNGSVLDEIVISK